MKFSLRSLFVVVTLCGMLCAFFSTASIDFHSHPGWEYGYSIGWVNRRNYDQWQLISLQYMSVKDEPGRYLIVLFNCELYERDYYPPPPDPDAPALRLQIGNGLEAEVRGLNLVPEGPTDDQ